MELKNFDQLVSTVKGMSEKRVVAVAAAADQHVIESVLEAKQEGIAQPILVGDAGDIKKIMGAMGLNPSDFDMLGTMIGSFQGDEVPGKIQLGSAWWFCDTNDGMNQQMRTLARLGLLGNFIGMLTDSRSLLSYARHEYFRRVLCALLGRWVENGEYPNDLETVGSLVADICYRNAKRYFNL